jgi:hypothetical protein
MTSTEAKPELRDGVTVAETDGSPDPNADSAPAVGAVAVAASNPSVKSYDTRIDVPGATAVSEDYARRAVGPHDAPRPHEELIPAAQVVLRPSIIDAEERYVGPDPQAVALQQALSKPPSSASQSAELPVDRPSTAHLDAGPKRHMSPARGIALEPVARVGLGAAPVRRMTPPIGIAAVRDPSNVEPLVAPNAYAASATLELVGNAESRASAGLRVTTPLVTPATQGDVLITEAPDLDAAHPDETVPSFQPHSRALDSQRPKDPPIVMIVVILVVAVVAVVLFVLYRIFTTAS